MEAPGSKPQTPQLHHSYGWTSTLRRRLQKRSLWKPMGGVTGARTGRSMTVDREGQPVSERSNSHGSINKCSLYLFTVGAALIFSTPGIEIKDSNWIDSDQIWGPIISRGHHCLFISCLLPSLSFLFLLSKIPIIAHTPKVTYTHPSHSPTSIEYLLCAMCWRFKAQRTSLGPRVSPGMTRQCLKVINMQDATWVLRVENGLQLLGK